MAFSQGTPTRLTSPLDVSMSAPTVTQLGNFSALSLERTAD